MAGNFPFSVESLEYLAVRKKGGSTFVISPWTRSEIRSLTSPLISLVLRESIFEPLVTGTLVVKETTNWFHENNLQAFDEVIIKIRGQSSTGELNFDSSEQDFQAAKTYIFDITNVNNTLDLATNEFQKYDEDLKSLTIEFVSQSVLNKEFLGSILETENFIGPIFGSYSGNLGQYELPEGSLPEFTGFNGFIKKKFGINIEGNSTANYCYLKKNNISYPWGKIKGQPTIIETLQYLAENAEDGENKEAVNYLFWQDLNGYHFKSIEKLIDDSDDDNNKKFVMGRGNLLANRIHTFNTISEFDFLSLLNSKAYFSWYERITPDYNDPYLDFIDTSDGLTRENYVFNLTQEYNKFNHIEASSIIPSAFSYTSPYTSLPQSQRVDDDVYGFYSENRYNTPFPQTWEYLGLSADPRLSNVTWLNQFDIESLSPEILSLYEKNVKRELVTNREKYTKLKNLKRKWEVYRCTICCTDQIGGTADQNLLANLTPENYVYYFGPTGAFREFSNEYGVLAAGAFSDVVNYDSGITYGNGLTLSYDMNSYPYNQSIAEFYNLSTNTETLTKNIDNAIFGYVNQLDKVQLLIPRIENFLANVDSWITSAVDLAYTNLTPDFIKTCDLNDCSNPLSGNACCNNSGCFDCSAFGAYEYPSSSVVLDYKGLAFGTPEQTTSDRIQFVFGGTPCKVKKLPLYVNLRYSTPTEILLNSPLFSGHWDALVEYIGDRPTYVTTLQDTLATLGFSCPNLVDGPRAWELPFKGPSDVPWLYDCTKSKLMTGKYVTTHLYRNANNVQEFTEFTITEESDWLNPTYSQMVDGDTAWCESCLDFIKLEVSKNEYAKVLKELKLRKLVLDTLISKLTLLKQNYIQKFQEFLNRKAFFISKNPFDVEVVGNIANKKSSLSLQNIKSIKRKPIRGSRYEILANRIGITSGNKLYPYNVFFDDNITRKSGITGNHPYYDQKYKLFQAKNYATKPGYDVYKLDFSDFVYYDNNFTQFVGIPGIIQGTLPFDNPGFLITDTLNIQYIQPFTQDQSGTLSNYIPGGTFGLNQLTNKLNLFKDQSTKIPSIEKEKIASYVRIEFLNPIGLDRLADFPTGFVRDAGSEYFLPYIVQLTSGPNGRQTIQNNAVVIGMDPYGFDVAVKKNRTKNTYTDYKEWGNYWWATGLNKLRLDKKTQDINDMSLWAETSIENEYTYFQNNGQHIYDVGSDYTEFDNYSNLISSLFRRRYNSTGAFYTPSSLSYYYNILNNVLTELENDSSYNLPGSNFSSLTDEIYSNYSSVSYRIKKQLDTKTLNSHKYGSYYLLGSHLHINPRRSWYDFFTMSKASLSTTLTNIANANNLAMKDPSISTLKNGFPTLYKSDDFISYPGNDFIINVQNSIKLKDTTTLRTFLSQNQITNLRYNDINQISQLEHIKNINSNTSIFSDDIERFLNGDLLIYRPGLLTKDVWKYDIFGDSEYGITKPPTLPPEYDLFDENFAAQFVVFGKNSSGSNICKQLNLKCANPKGPIDNSTCPPEQPYCNCPAQYLMPKEAEPSYKDLAIAYENTKECNLIKETLGDNFLGCIFSDPENVASCNCPEQGKFYPLFLESIRTQATFWGTDPRTPLRRQAQMSLFNAQKAVMSIFPDDTLRIGEIIEVQKPLSMTKQDRISGKWMITGIERIYKSTNIEVMKVFLNRDSIPYNYRSSEGEDE